MAVLFFPYEQIWIQASKSYFFVEKCNRRDNIHKCVHMQGQGREGVLWPGLTTPKEHAQP